MSTNLDTAVGPTTEEDVKLTSFTSGRGRGQMIQLHQGAGVDVEIIHMDEGQVRHTIGVMNAWLNNR